MNVLGTLKIFALAQKVLNLENLVHVSTCYVNSDKEGFIEEKIYDDYQQFSDPEQQLSRFLAMSKKELEAQEKVILAKHPNTYTFTKSLVEKILLRRRPENFNLSIVRPSIIGSSLRDPVKGWVETLTASSALFFSTGIGFQRLIHCDGSKIGDVIPVDYVADMIIVVAGLQANK